jgi:RNA 2',3'-cyclic 3'-phosphodiesterase
MPRLFVAIDLTDAQRAAASRVVESLQRALEEVRAPRAVRWAPPAQMHVTLRFIGEVAETDGMRLAESLAPPLAVTPFTLALGRPGVFPGPSRPRVLWIGLVEGSDGAAASHDEIEQRLTAAGAAPEARAFRAHLTIGRVRELRAAQAAALRDAMNGLRIDPAPATVTHTTLYRSHLSPKGARYEPLVRTLLTG